MSVLVVKILAWHLPLIAVLLIAYSFAKGEGKSLNITSIAILVVAFLFTNPATVLTKYVHEEQDNVSNVVTHARNSKDEKVIQDKESTKELIEEIRKESSKTTKKLYPVDRRTKDGYDEYIDD